MKKEIFNKQVKSDSSCGAIGIFFLGLKRKAHHPREAKNSHQNGITLIALIITIIILLILSTVVISITLGENGLFSTAKYSARQYKMAETKDKISLAIADIQTEYIANDKEISMDTLINELPNKIKDLTIEKDGEESKGICDNFKYKIDKDYNVIIEGLAESTGGSIGGGSQGGGEEKPNPDDDIPESHPENPSNYGKSVNYSVSVNGQTLNNWKLFYVRPVGNTNWIYLIYGDYLPSSCIPSACGTDSANSEIPYTCKWSSVPTYQNWTDTGGSLFMEDYFNLNENYTNSKCVSTLLNTNNWLNFVDSRYASYAIGSPTIQLWAESWKAKGHGTLTVEKGEYGYNDIIVNKDFTDTLFFPKQNLAVNGVSGYFLASPSQGKNSSDNYIMTIHRNDSNNINGFPRNNSIATLRPVVLLKGDVKNLTWNNTTNKYDLSE